MGRQLGRSVLRRGCVLVGGVLLAGVLGTGVSWADGPDPLPSPSPSVSVSPPSQQQIDDARDALERLRQQGVRSTAPALAQVAAPEAADGASSVAVRMSDGAWWTLCAALLVLVVASEASRLGARRARHRGWNRHRP
jgi:hypothetical protein